MNILHISQDFVDIKMENEELVFINEVYKHKDNIIALLESKVFANFNKTGIIHLNGSGVIDAIDIERHRLWERKIRT